ncbi:MAG: hypothetical protein PUD59_02515, partial [bacterium]|nr:hypothetical protein [bacterium]
NDSVFFYEKEEIISRLRLIFKLIGHDDLSSIVCQIIKAVEDKDNYFIYSAPLIQKIYKKLYLLLS